MERMKILARGEEDAVDVEECKSRSGFFLASAVCMIVVGAAGFVVSMYTGSDMVTVDFWDMVVDIAALIFSICVEQYKQYSMKNTTDALASRKNVLLIDACGGLTSFMFLLVVIVAGVFLSKDELENPQDNMIHNRLWVLGYALLSVLGDIVPMAMYRQTLSTIMSDDANKLNLLSGLMHIGIDLARAVVTCITSLWMLTAGKGELGLNIADGVGTLVICGLVLVSSLFVASEAAGSFREVVEINEELESQTDKTSSA